MNIAWLTPEVPFPPIGGRNGVYNRIVQLSKKNNIFLFSIAYNSEEKNNTTEMERYCTEVHFYDRSTNKVLTLFKSLFMPYSVASRYRQDIVNELNQLVEEKKIDIVIVDFPNMVKNVVAIKRSNPTLVITINQHNVEYIRMRDMKHVKSISGIKRLAYYLESFRLERYERKIYKSNIFSGITFFSEEDYKFFEKKINTGNAILKTIPLGANDYNQEISGLNSKTLLFVGRLDYIAIPNIEAIIWFVKNVFPKVLQIVPDAKLIIAGSNPEEKILNMANSNITIIPNFSSMKELYALANIVILPLLSGGGVKGKLLEAVAFRKHIITTDHGVEGTAFQNQKHLSLCNDSDTFAEKCIDILINPEKYREQEFQAYQLFKEKYDWNSIGKDYNDFIKKLISGE
ncbi:glycosyltransferase family 4 protein [Enterocloster bolteae]|jgi:glycosyltransferase involved in cell wall biosynthesis|uniref:glycosyltransferase family 4 protein n=1 Tax=Clostridia TaxID=186801 RepID=UPI001106DF64|nr:MULTISPECIES: glycosyltransferase family 4 protein [Clostridia]MCB7091784.1 glycosyltransferase family 4 protein [Enterocloster bolteae]MCH1938359.1 glycosyltransferase family 4 protein [Enterocloster sp. OA11]